VTVICGPFSDVTFLILGHPLASKFQSKYSHTHFIGFSSPLLACRSSCQTLRLHCAIGMGSVLVSTGVADMMSVSSTNTSKPCFSVLLLSGEVITHGVATVWYAEIRLSACTTHHSAASPRPWPAPYQGDSCVNVLYLVDTAWACFT